MNADLHEALSAIEGVERSEVELTDVGPLAVRVQLAQGADRIAVAEAVQRLLEAHGLRSRVAPDRRKPGPDTPPAPPRESPGPALTPGPPPPAPVRAVVEPSIPPVPAPAPLGIESVSVSETADGVVVAVQAHGGQTATRRSRRTERALQEAIVTAVGELFDPDAPSLGLRAIEYSETFVALTVYLEGPDGRIRTGASLIAAGRPFALAQAVWAALRD